MADLGTRGIYFKAILLLAIGLLAGALLLMESPSIRTTLLLIATVWAFARAYYFAFYVIEHYIDPTYKFSGLLSFARYMIRRRRSNHSH